MSIIFCKKPYINVDFSRRWGFKAMFELPISRGKFPNLNAEKYAILPEEDFVRLKDEMIRLAGQVDLLEQTNQELSNRVSDLEKALKDYIDAINVQETTHGVLWLDAVEKVSNAEQHAIEVLGINKK